MSTEKLLADFSGGMNALAAVDKLDPRECLLAENIRFDETGNIQSAGAYTNQNGVAYRASTSSNVNSVHSLYWNPSFGAVAGVGQDVFMGATLGGMNAKLLGKNVNQQKMSFASAPNRVYFDIGSTGYWTDLTNMLTVDWAPPISSSAITGPNAGNLSAASTATVNTATNFGFSLATATALAGVGFSVVATYTQSNIGTNVLALSTLTLQLLVGGSVVGTSTSVTNTYTGKGFINNPLDVLVTTYSFGGGGNFFGYPGLTPGMVNGSTFGFVYMANNSNVGTTVNLGNITCTAYQTIAGLAASAGPAGTLTGTYGWKVTFVAFNGEESDACPESIPVTLSAQSGTLTGISTGDARTVSRNIYRIGYAANTGLTLHYLVGSIPDNLTTTFLDNTTDIQALATGVILAGDVPGDYPNSRLGNTPVRYPVYHYDRVFWVNQAKPNQFIWSKPLNGFAYPSINFVNVGDSKPISRLVSIFGELIIVKTDSIWRLTGTDETSFDLVQTPSSVGTDQSFTVVPLPDKVMFANKYGNWLFNGYTSQPVTTKLDLWFRQEDRTGKSLFGLNGFHPPEVTNSLVTQNFEAVANSEKMYMAYAEAGQRQNNAILCFDIKHGNITKREPGLPLPLSLVIDPVTGFVYMGTASGFVALIDDWNGANGGGIGGSPINFDFQHGYQDFQRGSNKSIWSLEFFINTNGQSVTPYVYYDNGIANEQLAPIKTTSLQRVVRPLEATASRKCQNFSVRLNASLTSVNANGTPQIQVVHIKPYFDIRMGRARTGQ